ncbi:bifunctional transaldolase/phosoglucose isomerase [Hyphomicrobium denitrificans 1NES1]|uniref:Transaldolase n=1 Tax=Hyphomicrobium denitrificans 1NES1 TaxID=670307 RepID=N0B0F7_9HYPH|nr:bifunctional transaldolase/phosoglucose isomerase [Hyphomicrobium denitrificans]AGK56924.1 bifunctional transaldolase/phosoglucose isomerase [Hyphomicrobium denitrificans 1NES1]
MNPLKQLEALGQSLWLDYIKRSLIDKGELRTLVERDGLKGVTSNPSIFEKAIAETNEYTDALKHFQVQADHSISAIYEHLAFADIRAAADVLRPVYDNTHGRDGYVSLECSPYLANDTEATVREALRLCTAVDRPNLMVKVPATPAGIPAIRQLIGRGLNINITLLFSVNVYEQVVEAYISGLEDLKKSDGDITKVGSVASFFVSRIDTAVDKQLDKLGDKEVADELHGKAAIANAKLAYVQYKALFSGPRWERLAAAGAKTQRLLWASTSTKNPAYKDTMYVEGLVGRDTVNTMPPATIDAFRDHGQATPDAIEQDVSGARAVLAALEKHGISLKDVTDELVTDGVQLFAEAFDKLFGAIARNRHALTDGKRADLEIVPGFPEMKSAYENELEVWRKNGFIRRFWAGDKSLWTGADEDKWLGWLDIVGHELAGVGLLQGFAADVKQRDFTDVVLLGMGGSSLGPEVLSETFGQQTGWPHFHMLDSTDPAQIKAIERAIDLGKTLFIVSSKSGSTLEPNIFMDYFFERVGVVRGKHKAGDQFVAVTDPGSSLERRAKQLGFAHIFYGVPSIGGRYSVLSKFGLVPAAAMGLDVKRLLETALFMERACGSDVPPSENSGVKLGIALGIAATSFGRNKVTIIASPEIADLGAWLEQLLAESTGKHGCGLIPLADEPPNTPDHYGSDRFFAYLELDGRAAQSQQDAVAALEKAGHPIAKIHVKDIWHIGQEFFRWEIATAVAGKIIGIDPFDQPDVEASKVKSSALTEVYEKSHSLPKEEPVFRENGVALYADPRNAAELGRHNTLAGYLKSHFGRMKAGDYVALLPYIQRDEIHTRAMTAMRTRIRDKTHAATSLGFGPRFQHSTGQAYKGGPNSGVFLQVTCDDPSDIDVPGHSYSFGIVKAAQARGDLDVLVERNRRALRVHVKDVDAGLVELARAIDEALE